MANRNQPITIKAIIATHLGRARKPLPVEEIARRVIADRRFEGTSERSIGAILSTETNKPDGMFTRIDRGVYALR